MIAGCCCCCCCCCCQYPDSTLHGSLWMCNSPVTIDTNVKASSTVWWLVPDPQGGAALLLLIIYIISFSFLKCISLKTQVYKMCQRVFSLAQRGKSLATSNCTECIFHYTFSPVLRGVVSPPPPPSTFWRGSFRIHAISLSAVLLPFSLYPGKKIPNSATQQI